MTERIVRTITLGLWGGFIYYLIETAWRGYSHPSMFIVGGLCFVLIGGINNWFPWSMALTLQAVIGAAVVTSVELIAGIVLNIWLGLGVWDYSDAPLNILGQICLPFFFAWIGLAVVGIFLDDYLRWKLYSERHPCYTLL